MHPKTSIIVLAHNALDINKRFLHALYKHTSNFELIMIDNASSDGSLQYFQAFSADKTNMTLVSNSQNLGVIGGRNQGYEIYAKMPNRPEYFVFLDNDQFCQSKWLEMHHSVMEYGKYDIVGVEAWLLNSSFWPVKNCKRPGEPFSYVGCGGMMIKSKVTDAIGMFDNRFNPCYFEDPDFCFRARQQSFRIGWNYKAAITHLPHQTLGKNSKRWQHLRNSHAKFQDKWKDTKMLPMFQVKLEVLEETNAP
jgi:GT2 family glycosyltransferase